MFDIIIYKAETEIANLIRQNNSISHLTECTITDQFEVAPNILQALQASEEPRKNFDLHYLRSVLVSSVWNGNDDYFYPSELWLARNTAKDKPFNVEHECDDIIGHMVGSYAINDLGKIVAENTTVEDLPDTLHLISHAVIYKYWDKPEKQERINKIFAELKENQWFVSVECLFPNFDYILKSDSGSTRLIARNEQTSFLTKYLRVYGGQGVYQNERIARVPRNFILSGKGLVRKPANKNSIIFNKLFEISKNNINLATSLVYEIKEEVKNMDTNKEKEYQDKIAKLEADFVKLQASLNENKFKELEVALEKATKDAEAKAQELTVVKASLDTVNTEKTNIAKSLEQLVADKKIVDEKLTKIETEKQANERIQLCKSKLGMSDEDAKVYSESLNKLDEKAFVDHVEFQIKFVAKAGKVEEKVVVDEKVLEKVAEVKTEKDASLAITQTVASQNDKNKKVADQVAEFLSKGGYRKTVEKAKFQTA